MTSHYFTNDSDLDSKAFYIEKNIRGKDYQFLSASGIFSKKQIDFGTLLLIENLNLENSKTRFLDLGCGYGPVGIVIKKTYPNIEVEQVDVNKKAILYTDKNAKLNNVVTSAYYSDSFSNVINKFDNIALNPPIRAGKEVVFNMYKNAYNKLNFDGNLWIVIRKQQGAKSHLKFLTEIFENSEIIAKKHGYFVIKTKKIKKG